MGLVGERLELDGAAGVVVAEGGAGGLAAAGAGARSGHGCRRYRRTRRGRGPVPVASAAVTPAKRRPRRVTPSPKKAQHRRTVVAHQPPRARRRGGCRWRRAGSKAARRQKAADDRRRPPGHDRDRKGPRRPRAGGRGPEVLDADGNPVEKPRYGGRRADPRLPRRPAPVDRVAYVVVQSVTDYDFAVPAGVGAAVGQASAQVGDRAGPGRQRPAAALDHRPDAAAAVAGHRLRPRLVRGQPGQGSGRRPRSAHEGRSTCRSASPSAWPRSW